MTSQSRLCAVMYALIATVTILTFVPGIMTASAA